MNPSEASEMAFIFFFVVVGVVSKTFDRKKI